MKFIADLHIHSHFSRATSKTLDPEHLAYWAGKKGIHVIGTGDFTHPGWVSELQEKLTEVEDGLYKLNPNLQKTVASKLPGSQLGLTRFVLSGEISCIYKKNGKTRKVHHLILLPDMASVLKLNGRLDCIGNITSDGRPILGLDSKDLLEITLEVSDRAFLIPAHIWTPWFSVFGSKSGFDSLEECFEDLTPHIYALETGLSSDPPMNRLLSTLDGYLLVSNSDAHSPNKLGREANIFDTTLDYDHMTRAMRNGKGFVGTIEFFPEEGKYHLDGHRKCQIRLRPEQTIKCQGSCPVCGRPLTVGVLHRVHDLADRETPKLTKDFFSLIPLPEILCELLDCGAETKKVMALYERLLLELGPELQTLMDVPINDIEQIGGPLLAEGINRMRRNQVIREEGYDGEYGIIRLFEQSEKTVLSGQMALFAQKPKTSSKQQDNLAPLMRTLKKGKRKTAPTLVAPNDPILSPLNPEQKSAVLHGGGHLLVVAGPGTGKTMTLTHRIAYLIREGMASAEQICALTFTRKATKEMAERISALLQGLVSDSVYVTTFHGFCLDILRKESERADLPSNFTVCSEADAENIAREGLIEVAADKRSLRNFLRALPRIKVASLNNHARQTFRSDQPRGPDKGSVERHFFPLFEQYQRTLRQLGMLDYSDLEVEAMRLLRDHPEVCYDIAKRFSWMFVDEYQDTNPIQVELVKRLVHSGSSTICAIGDPDQAIYGFRGAEVENFHRFTEEFPGASVLTLTRNYRSTSFILEGSAALMKKAKPLESESSGGVPIAFVACRTESEEAEMVVEQVERLIGGTTYFSLDSGRVDSHEGELSLAFGDIGILFRLNSQGDALEEAMDRAGIPFVRSGEIPLIERYPINVLWRLFQTLQFPDNPYFAKMYDTCVRDGGLKRMNIAEELRPYGSVSEILDRATAFHGFQCSSEDCRKGLRRLKRLADNFEGDMEAFLDILSLERGIDHAILLGDRVALMSLHAAKGLEWPVVFITGCEDQLIPCALFGDPDEEEERRLLYVGMTRACSQLILSYVSRRNLNGRILQMEPSPFLNAIPRNLCRSINRRQWLPKRTPYKQLELF